VSGCGWMIHVTGCINLFLRVSAKEDERAICIFVFLARKNKVHKASKHIAGLFVSFVQKMIARKIFTPPDVI
jgi:hypothetical protein